LVVDMVVVMQLLVAMADQVVEAALAQQHHQHK
jgi:hypothetical protein